MPSAHSSDPSRSTSRTAVSGKRESWPTPGTQLFSGADLEEAVANAIQNAKLNGVDPRAWLADVLARTADHPASRLDELLPWNWQRAATEAAAEAA